MNLRSGLIAVDVSLGGGEGLRDAPDEDVLGLEVPVDDVVLVEVLQGPKNVELESFMLVE